MSTKLDPRLYEDGAMDGDIERDVEELHALMEGVREPEDPHPAYWNNFLLRVHEKIEAEQAPKRKAWWSPALIWGSISGVALLLAFAWFSGMFSGNSGTELGDGPVLASNDAQAGEELVITPRPNDEDLLSPLTDGEISDQYSIVLTQDDIDMINAIQDGDESDILMEMIDDPEFGVDGELNEGSPLEI